MIIMIIAASGIPYFSLSLFGFLFLWGLETLTSLSWSVFSISGVMTPITVDSGSV